MKNAMRNSTHSSSYRYWPGVQKKDLSEGDGGLHDSELLCARQCISKETLPLLVLGRNSFSHVRQSALNPKL